MLRMFYVCRTDVITSRVHICVFCCYLHRVALSTGKVTTSVLNAYTYNHLCTLILHCTMVQYHIVCVIRRWYLSLRNGGVHIITQHQAKRTYPYTKNWNKAYYMYPLFLKKRNNNTHVPFDYIHSFFLGNVNFTRLVPFRKVVSKY